MIPRFELTFECHESGVHVLHAKRRHAQEFWEHVLFHVENGKDASKSRVD